MSDFFCFSRTQDAHLASLFHTFPTRAEEVSGEKSGAQHARVRISQAVDNLRLAAPSALVRFLAPTANFLLHALATRGDYCKSQVR